MKRQISRAGTGVCVFGWLLFLCAALIPRDNCRAQPINRDIYLNEISDSLALESIFDSIRATSSDPNRSLEFIRLYKFIVKEKPTIENQLERVELFRGYRYNGIAWQNNKTNYEKTIRYLDSAQMVFDSLDYAPGRWLNTYGMASMYKNQGKNEEALDLFNEYLEHFSAPFDSEYVSNVQYQRGIVLQQMGKIEESTAAILYSIRLDEGMDRVQSVANSLNSIANGYKIVRLYDQAASYYQQAMDLYKSHNNQAGQALIAINYANMLSQNGKINEAISLYKKAEKWSRQANKEHTLSHVFENLGNAYTFKNVPDSATFYLTKAYDLRRRFNSPRELYLIESKLGKLALQRGKTREGIALLEKAFKSANELKENDKARDIAKTLSETYSGLQDFKKAYYYASSYASLQDSIINRDISMAIADMNTAYQTEKKEQEIDLLTAENAIKAAETRLSRLVAAITGLALLVLSLLTFKVYSDRKKIDNLNRQLQHKNVQISKSLEEKNILLKEIHHRVKNNLQVISSLLGIQSRKVSDPVAFEALNEGRSRVNTMSLIHQDLYRHDSVTGIDIQDYFQKLVHSLFQTYNISDDQIKIHASIDHLTLDVDTVIPLGLIINELISNALKYAFPSGTGMIVVSVTEKEDGLHLMVRDDGVGIDHPDEVLKKETFGYDLIKALVDKLEGKLTLKTENGTIVHAIMKAYKIAA